MAQYCKNCGGSLPDDARFCSACGTASGFATQPRPGVVASPLVRPRQGRQIAGVCAGFARAYGWDLVLVRILMVVAGILLFPLPEIAYIVGWVAMPDEPYILPSSTGMPPGSI
jgi:phage shock protein C